MSDEVGNRVAEIPGIYGTVSISERVIQRIWAQQDFIQRELRTRCGKTLLIKHPGRWNRAEEGPDFKEAVLEIDGKSVVGDVEIHFYAHDWERHGHRDDPHFEAVRLHVILFEPSQEILSHMPALVLGPYLKEDLESYLLAQSVRGDVAHLFEDWSDKPASSIRRDLCEGAALRWEQKVAFARKRLESQGFEEAVHGMTLEVLGYRRNRATMADVAHQFPHSIWRESPPQAEQVMSASRRPWVRSGLRPANFPEKRLDQYRQIWTSKPDWIERLRLFDWPTLCLDTLPEIGAYRRQAKLTSIRKRLLEVIDSAVGGTRLDTLVIDAWLPLISAERSVDLKDLWFAWYPGDFPENFSKALSFHAVANGKSYPHANVWNQGLLQRVFTR
ncbi:MAG: DUF2851 family protein [Opitutales bacterium]